MADRSLPGILLIALAASSVTYVAFSGGGPERLSILEIKIPERMYYSDEEYQVVASLVARRDLAEVDLRLHWLRGVGEEMLEEMRSFFGVQRYDVDALDAIRLIPFLNDVEDFCSDLGMKPTLLDVELTIEGIRYRVMLYSIGPVQELYMPERIGFGEGRRPVVVGDYALMINGTGHLVNFYVGYPAFFYDVERTLFSLEVDINREKSVYQNRSPESSLPRLRDLPLIGSLRIPLSEDDRLDVLISIEGRGLRLWAPRLCITEIRVDGELFDAQAFRT